MRTITAIVALAGLAVGASADIVAGWNFNAGAASGSPAPATVGASTGTGTASATAAAANLVYFTSGAGALNDLTSAGAGNDYAIQNGTSGANNGSTLTFTFDSTGYLDLVFSFVVRRTSTGFNSTAIQAFDGSTWVSAGFVSYATDTSYLVNVVDLSSLSFLNDNASASVRLVFSGGSTSSTSGNNRFDNVYFEGSLIPTPATAALMGLGGLVAARRRRA